jgi:GNAT superfamily N-acetyltransferase
MFQIRKCHSEDFDDVASLLRQLWPEKRLDAASLRMVFQRAVTSESQTYLCVIDGERIVGFGSLTLKNNLWQQGYLAHIDELVVDSDYRGRGIGTQLLNQLVRLARDRGCRRVELDSAFHREQAHQFYQQHGFENRAFLFSKII